MFRSVPRPSHENEVLAANLGYISHFHNQVRLASFSLNSCSVGMSKWLASFMANTKQNTKMLASHSSCQDATNAFFHFLQPSLSNISYQLIQIGQNSSIFTVLSDVFSPFKCQNFRSLNLNIQISSENCFFPVCLCDRILIAHARFAHPSSCATDPENSHVNSGFLTIV